MIFNKVKHIVIDLEALGGVADADCVITALSVVVIDGNRPKESYEGILGRTQFWKLSIRDQDERSSNPETVDWWEKQAESVKLQCYIPDLNRDKSPQVALVELNKYLIAMGVNEHSIVWSRGTAYDIPKLLNLYESCGVKPVFNSWNVADTKTAFLCRSYGATNQYGIGGNPKGFEKHNALHDTALEAYKLALFLGERPEFKTVKQRQESGELPMSTPEVITKGREIFESAVIEHLKQNGKAYTKAFTEMCTGIGVEATGIQVRKTLYEMQGQGKIQMVKLGQYPHWELV